MHTATHEKAVSRWSFNSFYSHYNCFHICCFQIWRIFVAATNVLEWQPLYQVFSYLHSVKEYPNREKTILEIVIFWPWENCLSWESEHCYWHLLNFTVENQVIFICNIKRCLLAIQWHQNCHYCLKGFPVTAIKQPIQFKIMS